MLQFPENIAMAFQVVLMVVLFIMISEYLETVMEFLHMVNSKKCHSRWKSVTVALQKQIDHYATSVVYSTTCTFSRK